MTSAELLFGDHDQWFKALIREFFADFLRLFFAEWAARFDLSAVEWLDPEVLPDPPDGSRHLLDLVAKLRALEPVEPGAEAGEWLALVHIEIESPDRTTRLKPRLPAYYVRLSDRFGHPVLPIVLYLNVALDGIGRDAVVRHFWDLEVLRLQYLYVGLPGLDAEAYVGRDNWLGVALSALMRIPPGRAADLGLEAVRRLREAGLNEQQAYLLSECVEAYLPVEEDELGRIRDTLDAESPPGGSPVMRPRNKTTGDLMRESLLEGRRAATLELLEALLASRFGSLPPESLAALRGLPDERLREIGTGILSAHSLEALGL